MPVHLAESKQRRTFRQQMMELMELFDSFTCGICYAKYNDTLNYPNVICQNFHIICSNCLDRLRGIQRPNHCPYCIDVILAKPIKYNKLFSIKDFAITIKVLQEKLSQKTREIQSLISFRNEMAKKNQEAWFKNTQLKFEIYELKKQIQKLKQQNKNLTEQLTIKRRQFSKELFQPASQLIIKQSTSFSRDELLSQAQNIMKLSRAQKQLTQQLQEASYWLNKKINYVVNNWEEVPQQNKSSSQRQPKEMSGKRQDFAKVNKRTQSQNRYENYSFIFDQKLEQLFRGKYKNMQEAQSRKKEIAIKKK